MSRDDRTPVVIRAGRLAFHGRDDQPAELEVVLHDRAARWRRALLGGLTTWAFAIAAVFLPVLHFVLVPALLIAGPLVAMQRLGERVTVHSVTGACAGCGARLHEVLRTPAREGIEVRCPACRRSNRVLLGAELLARGE